jgi:hypothetical protein
LFAQPDKNAHSKMMILRYLCMLIETFYQK